MIIDTNEEKIDVCCIDMMDQFLYKGLEHDWLFCPYCGEPIQYVVED